MVGLTVSQGHLQLLQARSLFEWEYTISYSKLPFVFRARNPPLRRPNVRLSVPTNELSPRYTRVTSYFKKLNDPPMYTNYEQ